MNPSRNNIEQAYCFFHQKWRVYTAEHTAEWQRDDIEYAISSYADSMDQSLYMILAAGRSGYLKEHGTFASDMQEAIEKLESMLG